MVHISEENGRPVLYVRLLKALYGTLQAALLFWEDLSGFLMNELGFQMNPYDLCVVNKMVDGKQCTAIWHLDDIKISHVDQSVLDVVAQSLSDRYGKHKPLAVHRGPMHDYLGMMIDYSEPGKVKFIQKDYVEGILDEAPTDFDGTATSPAANHLFKVQAVMRQRSWTMSKQQHSTVLPPRSSIYANGHDPIFRRQSPFSRRALHIPTLMTGTSWAGQSSICMTQSIFG